MTTAERKELPDLKFTVATNDIKELGLEPAEDDQFDRIVSEKLADIVADAEKSGLECELEARKTGVFMGPEVALLTLWGITIAYYFARAFGTELGKQAASAFCDLLRKSCNRLYDRFLSPDRNLKFYIVTAGKGATEPEYAELRLVLRHQDRSIMLVFRNGTTLDAFRESIEHWISLIEVLNQASQKSGEMPDGAIVVFNEDTKKFEEIDFARSENSGTL